MINEIDLITIQMGNNNGIQESVSHPNPCPSCHMSEWEVSLSSQHPQQFKNKSTGAIYHMHYLFSNYALNSYHHSDNRKQNIQKDQNDGSLYKWRKSNKGANNIVGVIEYYLKTCTYSCGFSPKCDCVLAEEITTVRNIQQLLPAGCEEVPKIVYNLIIDWINGFSMVYRTYGHFQIREGMLGWNKEQIGKVWINPNYAANHAVSIIEGLDGMEYQRYVVRQITTILNNYLAFRGLVIEMGGLYNFGAAKIKINKIMSRIAIFQKGTMERMKTRSWTIQAPLSCRNSSRLTVGTPLKTNLNNNPTPSLSQQKGHRPIGGSSQPKLIASSRKNPLRYYLNSAENQVQNFGNNNHVSPKPLTTSSSPSNFIDRKHRSRENSPSFPEFQYNKGNAMHQNEGPQRNRIHIPVDSHYNPAVKRFKSSKQFGHRNNLQNAPLLHPPFPLIHPHPPQYTPPSQYTPPLLNPPPPPLYPPTDKPPTYTTNPQASDHSISSTYFSNNNQKHLSSTKAQSRCPQYQLPSLQSIIISNTQNDSKLKNSVKKPPNHQEQNSFLKNTERYYGVGFDWPPGKDHEREYSEPSSLCSKRGIQQVESIIKISHEEPDPAFVIEESMILRGMSQMESRFSRNSRNSMHSKSRHSGH